jgi:micrococcal nuclease
MSNQRKKNLTVIIGCLYFILCCCYFTIFSQSKLMPVTVVNIIDGDTVTLQFDNGFEFNARLIGIDAPEINQSFGKECKDEFERLLDTKDFKMQSFGYDYYRRPLIKLIRPDYSEINIDLLRLGCAWLESPRRNDKQLYKQATMDAYEKQLNIWSESEPCRPKLFRKNKCPSLIASNRFRFGLIKHSFIQSNKRKRGANV